MMGPGRLLPENYEVWVRPCDKSYLAFLVSIMLISLNVDIESTCSGFEPPFRSDPLILWVIDLNTASATLAEHVGPIWSTGITRRF